MTELNKRRSLGSHEEDKKMRKICHAVVGFIRAAEAYYLERRINRMLSTEVHNNKLNLKGTVSRDGG
jgi:hypothetical protein